MSDLSIPTIPAAPEMPVPARIEQYQGAARPAAGAEAAKSAARDFESVLLYKLMEEMRRTIPESGLLSDGTTSQVQGIFWFYLAQTAADNGGLGLWRDIYRSINGGEPPADAAGADGGKGPSPGAMNR